MAITFRLAEEFSAPPQAVFAALTDGEQVKAWMPGLVSFEALTDGPFAVGSRFRETRKMFGKEATEEFEVTALEPDRRLDLYVDGAKGSSGSGEYRLSYTFEPHAGGTRVTLDGQVDGMGRMAELLGRLFAGRFKKALSDDLKAMKSHVEKGSW